MMCDFDLCINDFPDSLLIKILFYVDQEELHLSVSWVCKRWNILCYDRSLWRYFSQAKYESSFKFIDTRGFQQCILSHVHPYLKEITLCEPNVICFLDKAEWQTLQKITLPFPSSGRYSENIIVSVRNIQKSTGAKIYKYNRALCDDECLHIEMSYWSVANGLEQLYVPTKDWTEICKYLQENQQLHSVSLDCSFHSIPVGVLRLLSKMGNLKELKIICHGMEEISKLSDADISCICKNLQILTLEPYYFTSNNIKEMLSHLCSLMCLTLKKVSTCLSVIPSSCPDLIELNLSDMRLHSMCYLSDIASSCIKLQRITLRRVHGNLDHFLCVLGQKCKELEFLHVYSCKFQDKTPCMTGLTYLLAASPNLQTLQFYHINLMEKCFDFVSFHSKEDLPLRELSLCLSEGKGTIINLSVDVLVKMRNLTVLRLSCLQPISVDLIQMISATCVNLIVLVLREDVQNITSQQLPDTSSGHLENKMAHGILDQIFLSKIQHLSLNLQCSTYFLPDEANKFIHRSLYLEILELQPTQKTILAPIISMLGSRPHSASFFDENRLNLSMLSQIRWKQLSIGQWKNTWRVK